MAVQDCAVTALGTPRAESWDSEWLGFVDETEQRLGRRICGAHAPDGEPCELVSTHTNGRCRFHGGHPRIGAQPGNTNAVIHGLYSRRLRQCNDTCPVWRTCPFAGADVMALSERKRPICAYEREAYAIAMRIPEMEWSIAFTTANPIENAPAPTSGTGVPTLEAAPKLADLLSGKTSANLSFPFAPDASREDLVTQLRYRSLPFFGSRKGATTKFPRNAEDHTATAATPASPPPAQPKSPDPAPGMVDDTGAILYAMLQRATLTVSAHQLTEQTEAASERYSFRSTKPSAALTAFLRIGRELRAWLKLRPTPTAAADSGFADGRERAELNEHGYQQFYDHHGNPISFPGLMHPFLHELDAAVEQLRQEGIAITPP